MEENKLRRLIKSGRYVLGLNITIADPASVELAAYSGFDYVSLMFNIPTIRDNMTDLIRAAEAAQIPITIGMAGENPDPILIQQVLDLGADGIGFALVLSRQHAEKLVRFCKLAPIGDREAFPGGRIAKYWSITMEEYTHRANDVVIGVTIESKEGLEHAEEILSVPGIDMVGVAPSDLSRSLNVRRDSAVIMEATQHVHKLAKSAGVTITQLAMTLEELEGWVKREESLRVFFLGPDSTQTGLAFRGFIRRCNELVPQFAKGRGEGRVPGPLTPWLTPQSPGDKR